MIRKDDLVVVVATAHALKFSGTMSAYHKGGGRLANPPRHLPATLDAILAALVLLAGRRALARSNCG